MMKGGEHVQKAGSLFERAEKAIRSSRHSMHRSYLTILNNICLFHYSQQSLHDSVRVTDELLAVIRRDNKKKPLYLINTSVMLYKRGELDGCKKILDELKKLIDSEEGTLYFDLDNLKRIFLQSCLVSIKLKQQQAFEVDMKSYRSLLASVDEDPLSHAKADRMTAIGYIKFGQVDKAKKLLENY